MTAEDEIIVIKEIPYKDNDKILHALSKRAGKIQIIARGCRRHTSQLMNVAQIFAHSRCTLYKSRDMYIIDSAELMDSFYGIRQNIDSFMYGSYVLEMIGYVAQENQTDEKIFDMTVKLMSLLSQQRDRHSSLICAYELKLVSMLGFRPELKNCMSCGFPIKGEAVFSLQEGGFYCTGCKQYQKAGGINMEYKDIITMDRILKSKLEDVCDMDVSPKTADTVRKFLLHSIGRDKFTALNMIRSSAADK